MPFLYLEIVICYLFDIFMFGEKIEFISIVGSVIVSAVCLAFALK
jgi:drug/metabolite transporter (DMT)-like permease